MRTPLEGDVLVGRHRLRLKLLRGSPFSPVQLEDRSHPNAIGAYRLLRLLRRVLKVANLTLDLDVCALLERGCELAELAEDDAAMPFGVRDVLAGFFVLVRGLGGDGKRGEVLVVLAGANFCVAAEEAHKDCFVLVHGGDLRFVEFPVSCSGHTRRSQARGPASQGRSSAFTEGPPKVETVTRRAAQWKQKSEPAAGRRIGPKRDPVQRTGYEPDGTRMNQKIPSASRDRKPG